MLHQKWIKSSLLSLALGQVLSCGALADELTTNGGFEKVDLSGWEYFPTAASLFLLSTDTPGPPSMFGFAHSSPSLTSNGDIWQFAFSQMFQQDVFVAEYSNSATFSCLDAISQRVLSDPIERFACQSRGPRATSSPARFKAADIVRSPCLFFRPVLPAFSSLNIPGVVRIMRAVWDMCFARDQPVELILNPSIFPADIQILMGVWSGAS